MLSKLSTRLCAPARVELTKGLFSAIALSLFASHAAAQAAPDEEWLPIDSVAVVVNDEIITESELAKQANLVRARENVTISTREELEAFEKKVVGQMVRDRLRAQAGKSLGIEDEQLQQIVESHLEGRKRRIGLRKYIDDLAEHNMAAEELRAETKRQFLGQSWMDRVVGEDHSGQRPHRDRFIRPGYMHRWYVDNRQSFGEPELVEFERFVFVPEPGTDPVANLALLEGLRKRAIAGEPLTLLAGEIGPNNSGAFPMTAAIINLTPNPKLKKFAEEADYGAISEVETRVEPTDQRTIHEFFKLVKRVAPVAPQPFLDYRVQKAIDNVLLSERDSFFLSIGLQGLEDSAYIQPPLPPLEMPQGPVRQ